MTEPDPLGTIDNLTPAISPVFARLPARERKVFCCLCEFDRATAKEIAGAARMTASEVSSFLARLVGRNLVSDRKQAGCPPKIYRVAVPLVAVWYRVRRRGSRTYPFTAAELEILKSCQWTKRQFQAIAFADACVLRENYVPFGPTKQAQLMGDNPR